MVSLQDVQLSYGAKEVLRGITLEIEQAEILVIMGSSGAGKTSLLKCIAGLETMTGGEILLDGISVSKDPAGAHQKLGFVFQYAALFDYLNVWDNVLFGAKRMRKISFEERQELVAGRLEEVGLTGTEELMPSELSGGMKKRVGLARALALEPQVILYDEPTSGLDPVTAFAIDQLIVETRDKRGVTSIVVSHDVTSILRVADRIAFLDEGEIAFLGSAEEFEASTYGPIQDLLAKSRAETFSQP
jgi:phospholipid/cholesterol/gamma-HCH transport system ATP-binding protein